MEDTQKPDEDEKEKDDGEKDEHAPLDPGEKDENPEDEENPDADEEAPPPKRPWLTPELKRVLIMAGGATLSVIQLVTILTFISKFFGVAAA